MELSSTDPIFKIMDGLKSYINDNVVSIKFHNYTDWTETEFENFVNVLRNNYKEVIDDEVLEVINDDKMLKIFKIGNILRYCNTNDYSILNHKWMSSIEVNNEMVKDLTGELLYDLNKEKYEEPEIISKFMPGHTKSIRKSFFKSYPKGINELDKSKELISEKLLRLLSLHKEKD